MIGALPLVLFEIDNRIKQPHLTIGNIHIMKYPKRWFSFERGIAGQDLNAVCVQAEVKNEGFHTAEGCKVRVNFGQNLSNSYLTRWARENNPVELSISQDVTQVVDLFWIQLESNTVQTALSGGDIEGSSSYPKTSRYELSPGTYEIGMSVSASNMSEQQFRVPISSSLKPRIPEDVLQAAEESDVTRSIRMEEKYAIHYRTLQGDVLEMSEATSLSELTDFDVIDDTINGRPFAAYAQEKYDVVIDG